VRVFSPAMTTVPGRSCPGRGGFRRKIETFQNRKARLARNLQQKLPRTRLRNCFLSEFDLFVPTKQERGSWKVQIRI